MNTFVKEKRNKMQKAKDILQQLGGNKFLVMTGAKNLLATDNGLRMNLVRNISGASVMLIEVNSMDTYTMTFLKVKNYLPIEVVKEEGVYCDMLQDRFTKITGLNTRL